MDPVIGELLNAGDRTPGASDAAIEALAACASGPLPDDYLEFLHWCNGYEGEIGEAGWGELWSTDEVPRLNTFYSAHRTSGDIILIGTDQAGTAFGVDLGPDGERLGRFLQVDMHMPGTPEAIWFRCGTLADLLREVAG